MTPQEALLAAADYISENGHHKGDLYGPIKHGKLRSACILGALSAACRDADTEFCYAVTDLLLPIRQAHGFVSSWNDDPGTSAEDVILTLKRVAHGEHI